MFFTKGGIKRKMGTITDGKYKSLTGKEEYTEEEYAQLRIDYPEIEQQFKCEKEAEDKIKLVEQMKRRKAEIANRLSYIGVILEEVPLGITEMERKLTLQGEEANLRAELAYINIKLEE